MDKWFALDPTTGAPVGPYDTKALQGLLVSAYVTPDAPVWREGQPEWLKIKEVPELAPIVQVATELLAKSGGAGQQRSAAAPADDLAAFKAEIQALEGKGEGGEEGAQGAGAEGVPAGAQTPEELEFEDDDGTVYVWDRAQRKYMPKGGADLGYDPELMTYVPEEEHIPSLDTAIKAAIGEDVDEEEAGKEDRKRKGKEAGPSTAGEAGAEGAAAGPGPHAKKQKKAKGQPAPPPQEWFDLKNNTNVYVAGLPHDATVGEIHAAFSKFGLIKEDEQQQPRIKLYRDKATGELKGDALVSFLKAPSVPLAVNLLDGAPLRPGDSRNMVVQPAQFEMKGERYQPAAKAQSKKAKKALVEKQERRLGWGGYDDKPPPEKVTVIIHHMFGAGELSQDLGAAEELEKEVLVEATKLGPVEKVKVYKDHPEGVVSIKYKTLEGSEACREKMNGRFFGGRQLKTSLWDGITNYAQVKAKETPEQEAARLEAFAAALEGKGAGL